MLCKKTLILIPVFVFLNLGKTLAQSTYSITGSVKEKETNEAIPGAQVFLIGTTIGITTDEHGIFILKNIPQGIFDVSVSLLGYEEASTSINTNSLESSYNFILASKIYELDEVTVRPDLKKWREHFEAFKEKFIGTGPFSKNTKIKNPEVLSFDFDPDNGTLKGTAYDKLIIENKDLGYLITYYLGFFEINYWENLTFYYGRPLFTPLSSNRKRVISRWEKNRELAYNGSFLHFSRALIDGNASEQGFISRGERRDRKARYVSDTSIDQNIYFFPVDSSTYMFSFINFVNVTYEAEKEDKTYLEYIWSPLSRNPRTVVQPQNSSFTLTQDSVLIDKSGYIFNPLSVLLDGYWGFEKISDMMPLDYLPKENLED